jgi:RNA polymerase sigma-70 factor (ECF subfamily)
MSRLRTTQYRRAQVAEPQVMGNEGEEMGAGSRQQVADWSDLADEHVFRSEARSRVARAILELPAIYRVPVLLRDVQGMSTEEASAILHVKDQTLKSRLHRGRVILRKQLADFAGGLAMRPVAA